jgi:hypothetical protein
MVMGAERVPTTPGPDLVELMQKHGGRPRALLSGAMGPPEADVSMAGRSERTEAPQVLAADLPDDLRPLEASQIHVLLGLAAAAGSKPTVA